MEQKVSYEDCYKKYEEVREPKIVVNNYSKGLSIIDGLKFGFGFYIGFKAARTFLYTGSTRRWSDSLYGL